jgi:hypothetical protein
MINLSEYEIGQRFKTRGGWEAWLKCNSGRNYIMTVDANCYYDGLFYTQHGECCGLSEYDLVRPIYSVPHNASIKRKPMPTGYARQWYARQWPHIYQLGGGT